MNNPNIPIRDRAEVQTHVDALNTLKLDPELTQVDVAAGDEYGRVIYRLQNGAEERVVEALADKLSHQMVQLPEPKPAFVDAKAKKVDTKPVPPPRIVKSKTPALSAKVLEACAFFCVPVPPAPTAAGDVESQAINRP